MRLADYPENKDITLSMVVPVYNEVESISGLFTELKASLEALPFPWEIIFVDDGSSDGTNEKLIEIQAASTQVGVVQFRKNFGQTAALSAGFDMAHGNVIVTMDADLQNDPADIGLLIDKLKEGYDVVSGWRHKRRDSWLSRKLPSMIANRLISRLTKIKLHDYGCTLKAYRSEVVKNLRLYGELHRFIPALANERGAEVAEVPVNHRARQFGTSKYTLSRTTRVLLDLANVKFLLEYRTRPLQFFGKLGLISLGSAFLMFFGAVGMKIFSQVDLTGNPMLTFSLFLFMAGIQLISIGLIGELVTRAYYETQGKPIYVIRDASRPTLDISNVKAPAGGVLEDIEV